MALGIIRFSRHSIVPEELAIMIPSTSALTQVRSRYVYAVGIFTAHVRLCLTLINVPTSFGLVWVTLVPDMAVAAVRAGYVEAVSVITASV